MLDAAFLVSFKFSKCQLRELRKVCVRERERGERWDVPSY